MCAPAEPQVHGQTESVWICTQAVHASAHANTPFALHCSNLLRQSLALGGRRQRGETPTKAKRRCGKSERDAGGREGGERTGGRWKGEDEGGREGLKGTVGDEKEWGDGAASGCFQAAGGLANLRVAGAECVNPHVPGPL